MIEQVEELPAKFGAQAFSEAVVFVLDYYHAAERLHAFGGLLHGHDPGAARAWARKTPGAARPAPAAARRWMADRRINREAGAFIGVAFR